MVALTTGPALAGRTVASIVELSHAEGSVAEEKSEQDAESTEDELADFLPEQAVPMSDRAALLRKHKLNSAREEDILWFLPDAQAGKPRRVGRGASSKVFAIQYTRGDGSRFDAVFKSFPLLHTTEATDAQRIGIPRLRPQARMRNLATCALARRLGFKVVARTRIGWRVSRPSRWNCCSTPRTVPALVMERAKGAPASELPDFCRDPEIARLTTQLQLLDHLSGQVDRHFNNYFVHKDAHGAVTVTGIDNDLCFGTSPLDPHDPRLLEQCDNLLRMPEVVDTDMAAAIDSLTPEDLDIIVGTRLKDPRVLHAAKARLAALQAHIRNLPRENIIHPNAWPLHLSKLTARNSYFGRDIHVLRGMEGGVMDASADF